MPSIDFLFAGKGEVRSMLRSFDWSPFTEGTPDALPASLRTAIALMLDSSIAMYVVWGPELHFIYNDAYIEIAGDRHPDALMQPLWAVWPDARAGIEPIFDQVLRGEPQYLKDMEFMLARDGVLAPRWFTFSATPVRNPDNTISGILVIDVETTAQVLAERHRIAESEKLRRLFELAPGFMAVLRGPDHVFEMANAAYLLVIGERDYLGLPFRQVVPEMEDQGYLALLDKVYRTNEVFVGRGLRASLQRTEDGPVEERYLNFVFQPMIEHDGTVSGIFVEGNDVTDQHLAEVALKRLNEQLEEKVHQLKDSDVRKDEFLAMLAHELRNPLAPISAASELLTFPGLDADRIRQTGRIISRQARHMTGLIDDLMDVSRVTRGLVTLHREVVDARLIAGDAVEQVRPLIDARRHHLELHVAPETTLVFGDRKRLIQVVANVLNNAAKYTPEGGTIVLKLESTGSEVLIHVIDNGVGMTPTMIGRAFDLFAQADRSADRAQGGLGLGLALVKSLVELHHGTVKATSDGPGRGSTFCISLPRVVQDHGHGDDEAHPHVPAGEGLRIMVVDDNVDAAQMLGMLLEAAGHRVSIRHSAREALAQADLAVPDVFLLDIGLPDMDGNELARRLRGDAATANVVLVAVTGYGQESDRQRSAEAGFDHHLVKPVDVNALSAILTAARQ